MPAKASLECNITGASSLSWKWTATRLPDGEVLLLSAAASRSTLQIAGAALWPVGSVYELRAEACFTLNGDESCGASRNVSLTLTDLPLVARIAGGDRSVGQDNGLVLDASMSSDPDDVADPNGGSSLNFDWECASLTGACPVNLAKFSTDPNGVILAFPAGALAAANYSFTVRVVSATDSAKTTVKITVEEGRLDEKPVNFFISHWTQPLQH